MDKVVSVEVLKNYKKALMQKYNAVCLDIDGTLTEKGSNNIDKRIIDKIIDLLNNRVPIVFITGRGETGLGELKELLTSSLNSLNIENKDYERIFALTNDGARLFMSSKENLFSDSSYLIDVNEINILKYISQKLEKSINDEFIKKICHIGYSTNLLNNDILNVRIIMDSTKEEDYIYIKKLLNDLIYPYTNLIISEGIYKDKVVFQLGFSRKDNAIQKTEDILGIPKNSMLRIGDCGHIDGNDYYMLNCPQGFSVDKCNDSNDSCFPIINENGEVIKGVDATVYLLDHAKILSTICLESAIKSEYKKKFAFVEKQINDNKYQKLKNYNEVICENLQLYNGIYDIFDKDSGSVLIPMYEWELIDNSNELKKLFINNNDNGLLYSLKDNNNILFRGSQTYYYFLAHRKDYYDENIQKEISIVSKEDVINWFNNYILFFTKSIDAINKTYDFNDINNKKMILGILDNLRNILLICINHIINIDDINLIVNLENLNKDTLLYKYYNSLLSVEKEMYNICFKKDCNINSRLIINEIEKSISNFKTHMDLINQETSLSNYSKLFRVYREIDNFIENIITVDLSKSENKNISNKKGVCGISYGGIELPIIYKVLEPQLEDVSILKFNSSISSYKNKHSVEIRNFDINNYGKLRLIGIDKDKKYILADDNLLTAKTMQLVINSMYDSNINVDSLVIVRHPSINRLDQMFLEKHGAVDYRQFFDFIKGLYFSSPYSYRDENIHDKYKDSLGVFDLNRKKILDCLYKNHNYKENTEVSSVKGMVR